MKKRFLTIISVLLIMMLANVVFAGEWVQGGDKWKYKDDDGSFLTSTWKVLQVGASGYETYYFDENGYMVTGLKRIDGEVYAFNDDGTMKSKSKVTIDGESHEAEGKRIEGPTVNRTPEEEASIAAEEAVKEARIAAAEAAVEVARIEKLNNTMRISKTFPDAVTIKGDAGGKITVNLLIPTLVGGNSDVINLVLADKIKKEVYSIYEEKYGDISSNISFKVKDVFLDHDIANHTLKFHYWDKYGYQMFILLMDTNTLEVWSNREKKIN